MWLNMIIRAGCCSGPVSCSYELYTQPERYSRRFLQRLLCGLRATSRHAVRVAQWRTPSRQEYKSAPVDSRASLRPTAVLGMRGCVSSSSCRLAFGNRRGRARLDSPCAPPQRTSCVLPARAGSAAPESPPNRCSKSLTGPRCPRPRSSCTPPSPSCTPPPGWTARGRPPRGSACTSAARRGFERSTWRQSSGGGRRRSRWSTRPRWRGDRASCRRVCSPPRSGWRTRGRTRRCRVASWRRADWRRGRRRTPPRPPPGGRGRWHPDWKRSGEAPRPGG
mmetsp:Transcript_17556/g.37283  ORF Transcript_17556/g.37283 Transcript_17556/m.37283 type:complete len:278 (-) Transcript_17556:1176-2009(-)